VSRLRGHFSLEGATFEAIMSKHGLPKLVIHRKSGVPYVRLETLIYEIMPIERLKLTDEHH
jgi:hypothetical protein